MNKRSGFRIQRAAGQVCAAVLALALVAGALPAGFWGPSPVWGKTQTKLSKKAGSSTQEELEVTDGGLLYTDTLFKSLREALASKAELPLAVKPICQYPELPTGCEVTSLAMALNYLGIRVSKLDLADKYLDKGPAGKTDFRYAFPGNPRNRDGYGCYAPAIVKAANRCLKAKKSHLRARNLSGHRLEDLFAYLRAGKPVLIWGTIDCRPVYAGPTWKIGGQALTWYRPEHCMVLVGYRGGAVQVADPIYGQIRTYNTELFRRGYEGLQRQAVILQ